LWRCIGSGLENIFLWRCIGSGLENIFAIDWTVRGYESMQGTRDFCVLSGRPLGPRNGCRGSYPRAKQARPSDAEVQNKWSRTSPSLDLYVTDRGNCYENISWKAACGPLEFIFLWICSHTVRCNL
jgi:hypothetical protein